MFLANIENPLASKVTVLMLLGSSGVGKTFITEIIEETFPIKVSREPDNAD